MNLWLVVMAGGSGTRFWPKSKSFRPKQLLSFTPDSPSLLCQTLNRFEGLVQPTQQMIVTTTRLEVPVQKQVGSEVRILAEPQGRNTAPCIFWAAKVIEEHDPKAVMMVMPSDHFIEDEKSFQQTVEKAAKWAAEHDDIVTLGIKPSRPETGYGYLKTGAGDECLKVEAFVEKPNEAKAEEFLKEGNYLWNGGMFLWRAEVAIEAFQKHMPELCKAWEEAGRDVAKAYPQMTATSIDYGVMEKASNVVTYPLDCGWDDLGSWTALDSLADRLHARRSGGVVTDGEVIAVDSKDFIVDCPDRLVALLGMDNAIVVESGKCILVADKRRAQDIKKIVEEVKAKHPNEL